jgi:hypothetical protein
MCVSSVKNHNFKDLIINLFENYLPVNSFKENFCEHLKRFFKVYIFVKIRKLKRRLILFKRV